MEKRTNQRVAIVTGAARGIGQAVALGLARRGARVAILDVIEGDETVQKVKDGGGEAIAVPVDLTDREGVERAVAETRDRLGDVDIVVNNAAVSNSIPFTDVTLEEWRRVMSVNLDAPFMLLSATVPGMIERGWGRIVNVASSSIYTTMPDKVPYMSSKAGLLGLTLGMAGELGRHGITVNAVSPGLTMTPALDAQVLDGRIPKDAVEAMWAQQAIARVPSVEDVVGPVLFLTGDESAMVTGQFVTADGGITRHL
ncbi:SDR family NAD(P)-dependent oxidoreductase [Gordonia terrae]|uniref:SDR family NAD(P)-dependent oxidoreductase n=1 Tax=Gordonia terrae TaxID=2055 RepID=UPI003F6D0A07